MPHGEQTATWGFLPGDSRRDCAPQPLQAAGPGWEFLLQPGDTHQNVLEEIHHLPPTPVPCESGALSALAPLLWLLLLLPPRWQQGWLLTLDNFLKIKQGTAGFGCPPGAVSPH